MGLKVVPLDSGNEKQHRTVIATATNELIKVRPPFDQTPAEAAAGIKPQNTTYAPGNILRYGAGRGASDTDTAAFVSALASTALVVIPTGTYQFTGPILVPSNTVIWCEPGVEVVMPDGGLASDIGWIRMRDVEHVTIYGNGSRWSFQTKPVANEQRHVFDIRGSKNIHISGTRAEDSGGDGYYIGAGAINLYSERVFLEDVQANNCRRQGVSIVSVKQCWIYGGVFKEIDGTAPQAGIDIEPSDATDELLGIRIHNVVTQNCTGPGIKVVINDLPVGYPVDIVITGHKDEGSQNAFNPQYGTSLRGSITYRDCQSIEALGSGIFVRGWRSISAPILIENFTCDDPNDANDTSNAYNGHAISIFSTGTDTSDDIGNIVISGLRARDTRGTPQMKTGVYAQQPRSRGDVQQRQGDSSAQDRGLCRSCGRAQVHLGHLHR
jgi:hypothetical protein